MVKICIIVLIAIHWVVAFHVRVELSNWGVWFEHVRVEVIAQTFIIIFKRFENEQARNSDKYLSILIFDLAFKLLIFLCCSFNNRGEMNDLIAMLRVNKVLFPFLPRSFIRHHDFDQIRIVFQLRVYHFYISSILFHQFSEINKTLLDLISKSSDSFRLSSTDSSFYSFSCS